MRAHTSKSALFTFGGYIHTTSYYWNDGIEIKRGLSLQHLRYGASVVSPVTKAPLPQLGARPMILLLLCAPGPSHDIIMCAQPGAGAAVVEVFTNYGEGRNHHYENLAGYMALRCPLLHGPNVGAPPAY